MGVLRHREHFEYSSGRCASLCSSKGAQTIANSLKHLLIVYHSQTGNTARMARSAYLGATVAEIEGVETRLLRAAQANTDDLLWADGLLLGTPENFGYMSGAMKDFLDRTYYPCEGRIQSLPYATFISAGNDGLGALTAVRRIANGYPFKEVQAPIIAKGPVDEHILQRCAELGTTMAAGLELGMF